MRAIQGAGGWAHRSALGYLLGVSGTKHVSCMFGEGGVMAERDGLVPEFTGHDLLDVDGSKIGRIEDVMIGDNLADLSWLVVDTGLLGGKVLVPVGEVRRSGDRLSVPYNKDRVKGAPKAEDRLVLTEAEKGTLCRYYGLEYSATANEPAAGCTDTIDKRPGG